MLGKKSMLGLLLAVAGLANAAAYQPTCKMGDVSVPCERSAWDLGVDALYMKSERDLHSIYTDYRADWGWGFRLEGSYHFRTGNDVDINWEHFDKTTNARLNHDFGQGVVTTDSSLTTRFDIVNFEMAQVANFGEYFAARFHGGFEYTRLYGKGHSFGVSGHGNINGWGPRIGADTTYQAMNGFAVFANGAISLLTSRLNSQHDWPFGDIIPAPGPRVARGTSDLAITHLEVKAGGQYTRNMTQGDLTARVAWEMHDFLNAGGQQNAAWNGILFGLKWVGSA